MLNVLTLVLQIAVVLGVCRLIGDLFLKMGQPRVNGEMFAGILLGPSFLGWVWPHAARYIFPASSFDFLNALGQIGVVLFMFMAGLGINCSELVSQAKATIVTSIVSVVAPFALAFVLSPYLYPRFSSPDVNFVNFALLIGAAMTITAFPMLAKLLLERNMLGTQMGTVAVACSCIAGVITWCTLAYIVVLIKAQSRLTLWLTFAGIAVLFAVMFTVVQPLLRHFGKLYDRDNSLGEKTMAAVMVLVFFTAVCTGYLGLHPLFGAFLVGAIMPKGSRFVCYVTNRLDVITLAVLLPLYLAFSGLRTNLLVLRGAQTWFICGVIIVVGILGKVVASALAAWASGMKPREAAGLGALLNMRGLICLIVLNIGLDLKVLNTTVFSMMVVMAVVNTLLTLPLFELFCPTKSASSATGTVPAMQLTLPPHPLISKL